MTAEYKPAGRVKALEADVRHLLERQADARVALAHARVQLSRGELKDAHLQAIADALFVRRKT